MKEKSRHRRNGELRRLVVHLSSDHPFFGTSDPSVSLRPSLASDAFQKRIESRGRDQSGEDFEIQARVLDPGRRPGSVCHVQVILYEFEFRGRVLEPDDIHVLRVPRNLEALDVPRSLAVRRDADVVVVLLAPELLLDYDLGSVPTEPVEKEGVER